MVSLAPWTCPSASSFSLLRRRSSPIPFAPLRDSLCAGPGLCSFQGALEEPRPSPVPGTSRVMRLRVRFPCFRYATNLALFPSASRILSPSPRIFRIRGERKRGMFDGGTPLRATPGKGIKSSWAQIKGELFRSDANFAEGRSLEQNSAIRSMQQNAGHAMHGLLEAYPAWILAPRRTRTRSLPVNGRPF